MRTTTIHYTKKTQRLYVGGMTAILIAAGIPAYFSDAMLVILIPIHLIGVSSFAFFSTHSYKTPLIVLTENSLQMDTPRRGVVLPWKDIIAYHITEKGKDKILTVISKEQTAERSLTGLDKSPHEILSLLNKYKSRR